MVVATIKSVFSHTYRAVVTTLPRHTLLSFCLCLGLQSSILDPMYQICSFDFPAPAQDVTAYIIIKYPMLQTGANVVWL